MRTGVLCTILLLSQAWAFSSSAGSLRFDVIPLGPVQSELDSGKSINESGTVAFTQSTAVYLWQNGTSTAVPNLFANNAQLAMNDAGHLAGADQLRGFLYKDGVKTDLGTLDNGNTFAHALNNDDVVVGESYDFDVLRYRAFVWQNGDLQRLPAPGGSYAPGAESRAHAINASNEIAGSYNNQGSGGVAVIWNDGVATPLTTLAGYDRSEAFGINDAGQAVGYSADSNLVKGHAVLWNGATPTDLGNLPNMKFSLANAINSQAMVVGSANRVLGDQAGNAFLWMGGQMFDLNGLIDPTLGWHLSSALDINDQGAIVGYGTLHNRGESFLLIPIPEPPSSELLALGVLSLIGYLWHRHSVNVHR